MMFRSVCIVLFASIFMVHFLSSCSSNRGSVSRGAQYEVDSGAGVGKRWLDNRVVATEIKSSNLATDGIHDPKGPSIGALQEPSEAMASFPLDRRGDVDWVKTLNLGITNPRFDISGNTKAVPLDLDVLLKNTDKMPWVKFSHGSHTQLLDCGSCHPSIFIPQKGANKLSMDEILAGEQCGICHGKAAFSLWTCERCHNLPHEGTPKRWNEVMGVQPVNESTEESTINSTKRSKKDQNN